MLDGNGCTIKVHLQKIPASIPLTKWGKNTNEFNRIEDYSKVKLPKGWILLLLILAGTALLNWSTPGFAQLAWQHSNPETSPLKIYAEFDKFRVNPGAAVTLIIRGFLEPSWHVYSIHRYSEDAPTPTTVSYPDLQHEIISPLQESPPSIVDDQALDLRLAVHKEEFVLQQQFKISPIADAGSFVFEGTLHFQLCDNNICTPRQHLLFSTPLTIEKQ